jgi:hypothetical protein
MPAPRGPRSAEIDDNAPPTDMMAMLNTHTTVLATSDLLNSLLLQPWSCQRQPQASWHTPVLATVPYHPVCVD